MWNLENGLTIGNTRIIGEKETHQRFMEHAMEQGLDCYVQYITTRQKYLDLLKNCKNEKERNDICDLAAAEITALLFGTHEVQIIK